MQNTKHGTISTKEAAVRFTSIRHIAHIRRAPPTDSPEEAILQVPVPFFFEGAPAVFGVSKAAKGTADAPSPAYVTDFLATSDGLALVKAFMCIEDAKLRRAIVRLVEEIVPETGSSNED